MKKVRKTPLLSFLLLLALLAALCCQGCRSSAKAGPGLSWTYNYEDYVLTITGEGRMEDYEKPEDVPWHDLTILQVNLPNSVTSIGNEAFRGCSTLTSVKLPEGLKSIGGYAFAWCDNLTFINLPKGLKSIGEWAFIGCDNLTLTVVRNTYAEQYCKDYYVKYKYS